MNPARIITKIRKAVDTVLLKSKASYSQSGEDLIIDYFFESIGIKYPNYIDIGTNHPVKGNNTYLFYLKGCRGICIEPDVSLIPAIRSARPRDTVLNIGISLSQAAAADFYFFEGHFSAWNTFSLQDAERKKEESGIAYKQCTVKLDTVKNVVETYGYQNVNLLSLDVEGLDLEVLQSIDFSSFRPDLICVETILFSMKDAPKKNKQIIEYMLLKDYIIYADTSLNTIFYRKELFP